MPTNDTPKKARQIQMEKAQAKRDVYDKRSNDVAEARNKALEIDAVKTARLRTQRLAKEAANEAAAPPPKPAGREADHPPTGSRYSPDDAIERGRPWPKTRRRALRGTPS